ncbi:MAG: phosphatidate cytidylyltransferase [Micavibrio sp.]|nr:phosphatidate cytidylyltransferase [Micavibrio sp.]
MDISRKGSLQKRILSVLVMAPVFLTLVWFGNWPFMLLLFAAFFLSIYEWYGLVKKLPSSVNLALILGIIYMSTSYYSFHLLRELGVEHMLLLLFMVWASDIGAYFFGKLIGGPKLIPQISPNKTWAGLAGAVLCPSLVVLLFALNMEGFVVLKPFFLGLLLVIGVIIGLLGQAGDLLMSFMKRKAKVKDTGALIPGHGGILDRIDSLLLVTPFFYILLTSLFLLVSIR